MPIEQIEEHKTHSKHSYNQLKGIGLIVGQIKYGPNKGLWVNFFDADNQKGKEAILEILGYPSVDDLKKDCVIEYHPSAPHKFHLYLLSEVPFDNFTLGTKIEALLRITRYRELKVKGEKSGLAYPTPSLYAPDIGKETGERYQLLEGSVFVPTRLFTENDIVACEKRFDELARNFGNASYGKRSISELLEPDFRVTEGNNRKRYIIQIGMHYLHEYEGDEDKAEKKTREWNEKHCVPPLTYEASGKFDDAWEWTKYYYERDGKKSKESKKEQNIKTATRIVEDRGIQWFHDEYQTGFMRVKIDEHYEIYRVSRKDRKFKLFITKIYYDSTGGATLKDDELAEVLRALEAKATFSKVCKNIHLRKSWAIKSVDQRTFKEDLDKRIIFYDMCDPDWRCIMVDGENGTWHMLPTHPENMPFFRYQQRPQVTPKKPNEYPPDILDAWAKKMHITDPKGKLLFKVKVIAFFIPDLPDPILIPVGMAGAAKSTLCKQLQQVTDPYAGDALMLPDSKRESDASRLTIERF